MRVSWKSDEDFGQPLRFAHSAHQFRSTRALQHSNIRFDQTNKCFLLGRGNRRRGRWGLRINRAVKPGCVPKIQEHLRARSQSASREVKSLGGTFAGKATRFLQGINKLLAFTPLKVNRLLVSRWPLATIR
jgi:hypothetical protein